MRIVQIVRRADADVIHALPPRAAPQLLEMPVEALDFSEETGVEAEAVEDPDSVVRIGRGHQLVAGVADGFHVAGRNKARRSGHGEVHSVFPRCDDRLRKRLATAQVRP
jgi:hypothetical protein